MRTVEDCSDEELELDVLNRDLSMPIRVEAAIEQAKRDGLIQRKAKNDDTLRALGGALVIAKTPNEIPEQQKAEPGSKFDAGKARIDLIAPELLFGTAEILDFGAKKYGSRNWEQGMSWSRPFGALMRHMWAWWRGEALDEETGKSHLWHASCCLMFLIAYEERKTGTDDRFFRA